MVSVLLTCWYHYTKVICKAWDPLGISQAIFFPIISVILHIWASSFSTHLASASLIPYSSELLAQHGPLCVSTLHTSLMSTGGSSSLIFCSEHFTGTLHFPSFSPFIICMLMTLNYNLYSSLSKLTTYSNTKPGALKCLKWSTFKDECFHAHIKPKQTWGIHPWLLLVV